MARFRRTDTRIYDGNGETVRFRDEEDQDNPYRIRSKYDEPVQDSRTFGASRREADDGLPVYDEFDERSPAAAAYPAPQKRRKPRTRHRGLWLTLIFFCLLILLALALSVLPQTLGVRYKFLPNPAFVNGKVITLNEADQALYLKYRDYLYTDRIYPNIYIDGVYVGDMTKEEAAAAVSAAAEDRQADFEITLTVGGTAWSITPLAVPVTRNVAEVVEQAWAIGRGNTASIRGTSVTPARERLDTVLALRTSPVSLTTVSSWDRKALRAALDSIAAAVNRDPVNSTVTAFDFGSHTFSFSDDVAGTRLDTEYLFNRVAELLDSGDVHTSLSAVPEKVLADVTKSELMNSFVKISSYTTKTTSNKNRNTNIRLSAEAINGTTVLPGEIFSFNGTTGERTAAKGYREATAISGGATNDEIGGGVCQTSSTLFNAVARANLEIITRSPHAWPSSYVAKGMDATVNWPGLDFKFRNNTDWPIFIVANYSNQKITVDIYGMTLGADLSIDLESNVIRTLPQPSGTNYVIDTSLKPGTSKTTVQGRSGCVVETWKVWYQGSRELKRELLCTSTYKAYQETVAYNPAD